MLHRRQIKKPLHLPHPRRRHHWTGYSDFHVSAFIRPHHVMLSFIHRSSFIVHHSVVTTTAPCTHTLLPPGGEAPCQSFCRASSSVCTSCCSCECTSASVAARAARGSMLRSKALASS